MVLFIVVASALILLAAYYTYGKFLANTVFKLDDKNPVPSVEMEDGVDYVPAKKGMLLGQHFSAIAAAGPINGPILAAVIYGWAPALLWVILGCIFIGGIHDMGSLVASVRHKAKSITEVVRLNVSQRAWILFMIFVWITLVYVIVAAGLRYCSLYRYYRVVLCRQRNAGKRRSCFRRRHCKFFCHVSGAAYYYGPFNALWRIKGKPCGLHLPAAGWRCYLGWPVHAAQPACI